MKYVRGVLFFFLLLAPFLQAQISDIPAAQLLVDHGLEKIEEEQYEEALQLFLQARELDQDNPLIENLITSLSRTVALEDYRSDPGTIDSFIEERAKVLEEEEEQGPITEEEGDVDFITQQQNKEKARQDRSRGQISLYFPLLNSSNGDKEVDNDLRLTGEVFQGFGYNIAFFPELFNRTIGIEGGYGSFSFEIEEEVNLFEEARFGIILRNFFNEQPGSYSLVGTHLMTGLLFGENLETEQRRLLPFWRFEVFFRDPVFYRLVKNPLAKNMALQGKFQFSLLNETYMYGFGGGLDLTMGSRLDVSVEMLYRNYTENNQLYPSWTTFLGMNYSFR